MMPSKHAPQILVIDDSRLMRKGFIKLLSDQYDILEASDGVEGWQILQENDNIAMVFTDLNMPNMDGFDLLKTIRSSSDPAMASMPVVVITGRNDSEEVRDKLLNLGATDLIGKPYKPLALKARAKGCTDCFNYRVGEHSRGTMVDELTGLDSFAFFRKHGEKQLSLSRRHGHSLSVVRIDVTSYTDMLGRFGTAITDRIIVTIAKTLNECLRLEDSASYMGADKFALLLPCATLTGADEVIARITERTHDLNLKIGEEIFKVGFCTGIDTRRIDSDELNFQSLVDHAEAALRQALSSGPDHTVHYKEGKVTPILSEA